VSGSTPDRGTEASHRFHAIPLLDNLAAAGLVGALFGLVDFFLFEIHGHSPVIHEFVLSKPSFWSLSSLSYQVVIWILIAIIMCLLAYFSIRIASNMFSFLKRFSTLTLTALAIFSLIMTLRFLQNSQQFISLFSLLVLSLTIIVFVLLLENGILKKRSIPEYLHSNRNLISSFLITVFIVSVTFLAPDISSAISRISRHTEIQDSDSPNVLFIVLDTVRPDHLSCYGYNQNETPNIDRVSRDSLLFLNAFSTAPWTLPSHASMFTDAPFPRINVHRAPREPTPGRLGPHVFSQRPSNTRGVPARSGIPHRGLQ
jgi:hypothetical protein